MAGSRKRNHFQNRRRYLLPTPSPQAWLPGQAPNFHPHNLLHLPPRQSNQFKRYRRGSVASAPQSSTSTGTSRVTSKVSEPCLQVPPTAAALAAQAQPAPSPPLITLEAEDPIVGDLQLSHNLSTETSGPQSTSSSCGSRPQGEASVSNPPQSSPTPFQVTRDTWKNSHLNC